MSAEYGWTIYACPDCGLDRGPEAQFVYRQCDECGSHKPQQPVDVVPKAQADKLVKALRKLDPSDAYTLEQAESGELVSMTRPVELWRKLAAALADYETEDR